MKQETSIPAEIMSFQTNYIFNKTMIAPAVALLLLGGLFAFPHLHNALGNRSDKIAYAAERIINTCKSSSHTPTCYEQEIPKLMDNSFTMEEAFLVTRSVQDKDRSFSYCHVLGHKLSAQETKKNPSRWKEVVARCPSGMCSNGCIHGAFQERFRSDSLSGLNANRVLPEIENVCEATDAWRPTGLEQASCYHALGHLAMYITNAQIDQAIGLCKKMAVKPSHDFSQLCFDGAFMQLYQPLEPDDFALIRGKEISKEQAPSFCSRFPIIERSSCVSESWPLFKDETLTANGIEKLCGQLTVRQRNRCYSALFYVAIPRLNFDARKIEQFCKEFKEGARGQCFANAASRLIETDYRNINRSTQICTNAPADSQKACFEELVKYSTFNFKPGSSAALELCNALPQPWNSQCVAKTKR